ncbi:MAG: nucleotidyltransferase [Nanoarchaeota archaeon]
MKKEFTYKEFEKVIGELETKRIEYFVFGGFAFDTINNKKENHGDLDIVIFEKDKEKIKPLFEELGYTSYLHGRKHEYQRDGHKVDVIFIAEKKDHYEIMGNVCRDKVSKDAFAKKNRVETDKLEFTIMPYEWFSLYKGKHYKKEKRKTTDRTIEKIKPLCKRLKVLSSEKIPKPKNMEKIRLK